MMVKLIPFRRSDLDLLEEQAATAYLRPHLTDELLRAWESSPFTWTAIVDGMAIGCGGIHSFYPATPLARGEAWALLDRSRCREHFIALHCAVRKVIRASPFARLEATVDAGFRQGHRWVTHLGFQMEGLMRRYRPDGRDAYLYSIVRES